MSESLQEWRRKIAAMEDEILAAKRRLAELRRQAPEEAVADYELRGSDGEPVHLSELFGDKDDLVLVHNMGKGCTYCTLWADGFNGLVDHLESRAAFVVGSPDRPEVQREFAAGRGWRFRMVSVGGTSFNRDMGFEENGSPTPGISTFRRGADGALYRVSKAEICPGDDFCPTWHFLDLLAKGADGWEPQYRYGQ